MNPSGSSGPQDEQTKSREMGFGGSVSAMISSLKENKILLAKNKEKKRKVYEQIGNHPTTGRTELKFKEVSEEELEAFRARLAEDLKKERRTRMIFIALFVITAMAIGYAILRVIGV